MSATLFGLPEDVRFCTRCVISNQRPNSAVEYRHTAESRKATIVLDAEGVCSACRVAERKAATDWSAREAELVALCDRFRAVPGYNCLVPGSGGKDSWYQAHQLKYKYGMRPLTVTWAPNLYTDWGWKNHRAWINSGFDNILVTPNGQTHRMLTRLAVENLFHPFQPFMFGQKMLGPRLAAMHGIPLVFYGENEAEYGNPIADMASARRAHDYFATADRSDIYLGGTSLADLTSRCGLTDADLAPYTPLDPAKLNGVEVHYLGHYLRWHPQECYYYAVEHGGFTAAPERTPGTYSKYNSLDDKIDDLHYWCTYVKFGLGRATYDAAQEIRSGDITRDEGVALVKRYDGEWPARFDEDLMRYLSVPGLTPMTIDSFQLLSDRFRSPHLWDGRRLRHAVWHLPTTND